MMRSSSRNLLVHGILRRLNPWTAPFTTLYSLINQLEIGIPRKLLQWLTYLDV